MPLLFQWLGGPANPLSTWPSQAECLVDTCKKRGTGLRWIQMSQGILLCPVTFRSFGELEIILCFLLSIWIHCCMSLSHLFILRKHCEWEPAHPDEDPKNEQTKTWSSNSRRIPDLEDPLLLPAPIFCLDDLPSMFWTAGCLCIFVSKCVKTCLQAIEILAKLWGQSRAKIMDLNTATCGFSNLKELILDVMNPRFLGAYIFPQKYGTSLDPKQLLILRWAMPCLEDVLIMTDTLLWFSLLSADLLSGGRRLAWILASSSKFVLFSKQCSAGFTFKPCLSYPFVAFSVWNV